MSEKLNINDFKSDHGDISRLESDEGTIKRLESDTVNIRVLTVELLKLKNQIELLSKELKIVKDGREVITVTSRKTEVRNWLYTNDELITGPIGTVVAFAGYIIPYGWELCDGGPITTNYPIALNLIGDRKPNLINRFIRGTASESRDERGSDEVALVAENLPPHSHVYYEPRIDVRTKLAGYGIVNNDQLYNSHITHYDKRLTNNNQDSDDHRPSRLEGRRFSIIPSHVTLRYIIKLM